MDPQAPFAITHKPEAMIHLQDIFERLPIPKSTKEHTYTAMPIKGFNSHKIGKDIEGNPSLLLEVNQEDKDFVFTPYNLYNLSITHHLACEVLLQDKREERSFSVIHYTGHDESLKSYFLKACEVLVPTLGNFPNGQKITSTVNKFIDLFRLMKEPPTKTVQGLWAELFFIHQLPNPKQGVAAWHQSPEEKYDFSLDKVSIEVKSYSTRERIHHFTAKQLTTPTACTGYVVSIFVEPLAGGQSLQQLLDDITARLDGDSQLVEKLHLLTYTTLGSSLSQLKEVSYNYHLAKESLALYHTDDVPKITYLPHHVFDVKFRSSLDHLTPLQQGIGDILLT